MADILKSQGKSLDIGNATYMHDSMSNDEISYCKKCDRTQVDPQIA